MEFKVGQSEECPICIHEFSQDMSAGQVTPFSYVPARRLQPLLPSCGSRLLLCLPRAASASFEWESRLHAEPKHGLRGLWLPGTL